MLTSFTAIDVCCLILMNVGFHRLVAALMTSHISHTFHCPRCREICNIGIRMLSGAWGKAVNAAGNNASDDDDDDDEYEYDEVSLSSTATSGPHGDEEQMNRSSSSASSASTPTLTPTGVGTPSPKPITKPQKRKSSGSGVFKRKKQKKSTRAAEADEDKSDDTHRVRGYPLAESYIYTFLHEDSQRESKHVRTL